MGGCSGRRLSLPQVGTVAPLAGFSVLGPERGRGPGRGKTSGRGQRPAHPHARSAPPAVPLPTCFLLPQPCPVPGCLWPACVCTRTGTHAHVCAHTGSHACAHVRTHAAETPGGAVAGPAWPLLSSCLGGRSGLSRPLCGVGGLGPHRHPRSDPAGIQGGARSCLCRKNVSPHLSGQILKATFWNSLSFEEERKVGMRGFKLKIWERAENSIYRKWKRGGLCCCSRGL